MHKRRSILLHFESEHDLLYGIKLLQYYQVAINELYLPHKVARLRRILRIREIKRGSAVLRYGCLGGAALSTLLFYIFWQSPAHNFTLSALPEMMANLALMALTFWVATVLFPSKAPKLLRLPKGDPRYLVVISNNEFAEQQGLRELFHYTRAVELSPLLKDMITA